MNGGKPTAAVAVQATVFTARVLSLKASSPFLLGLSTPWRHYDLLRILRRPRRRCRTPAAAWAARYLRSLRPNRLRGRRLLRRLPHMARLPLVSRALAVRHQAALVLRRGATGGRWGAAHGCDSARVRPYRLWGLTPALSTPKGGQLCSERESSEVSRAAALVPRRNGGKRGSPERLGTSGGSE